VQLNPFDRQMLWELGAAVRSAPMLRLALASLVLSICDLLGERRRYDEVGDLSEGELHLRRVDSLALVLSAQMPPHTLELQHHELVELAVLVALTRESVTLLTHASQLLFELLDPRVHRHDEALVPRAISTNKKITSS
jgi:hypothetical protein